MGEEAGWRVEGERGRAANGFRRGVWGLGRIVGG